MKRWQRQNLYQQALVTAMVTCLCLGVVGVHGDTQVSSASHGEPGVSPSAHSSVHGYTIKAPDPEVKSKTRVFNPTKNPADGPSSLTNSSDALKSEFKINLTHFLSQPVVNAHDFDFIRNPVNACAEIAPLEVLFVVPSAPGNFEKRDRVRKGAIGTYARDTSNNAKVLFFTGTPECSENWALKQAHIDNEFYQHGDIVQENFPDVYRNIRLKAVSMLRWAVTYCKRATYVIRTDDDVEVNVAQIVSTMRQKSQDHPEFVIGVVKDDWGPVRKSSKYKISVEEYPDETYPPFALGGLLGYPMTSAALLYQATLRVKPIWLDDVYITGICARKVGVTLLKDPNFTFKHLR